MDERVLDYAILRFNKANNLRKGARTEAVKKRRWGLSFKRENGF